MIHIAERINQRINMIVVSNIRRLRKECGMKTTEVHQFKADALKQCHIFFKQVSASTQKTKKESPSRTGRQKCKTTFAIAYIGRKLQNEATYHMEQPKICLR